MKFQNTWTQQDTYSHPERFLKILWSKEGLSLEGMSQIESRTVVEATVTQQSIQIAQMLSLEFFLEERKSNLFINKVLERISMLSFAYAYLFFCEELTVPGDGKDGSFGHLKDFVGFDGSYSLTFDNNYNVPPYEHMKT